MRALKILPQRGKLLQNSLYILSSNLHLIYHKSQDGRGLNLMIIYLIHLLFVFGQEQKTKTGTKCQPGCHQNAAHPGGLTETSSFLSAPAL